MFNHFYSDPHFGHKNIIEFCDRPFTDTEQMDEWLVREYNRHVKKTDFVLWCGDVSFANPARTEGILGQLYGRRAIVLGNHDRPAQWYLDRDFEFALDEIAFRHEGVSFRACHYPPIKLADSEDERYPGRRPVLRDGEILIHGHTHSKDQINGRCVHVGVDAWNYRPASIGEVMSLAKEALA